MKNLVLATAAVLAFGIGTAFADGNVSAQPARNSGAFASTSRGTVWIYPAFTTTGGTQGGQQ
jgi:hypothetical protein